MASPCGARKRCLPVIRYPYGLFNNRMSC